MRRLRPLLAASVVGALALAGAACTTILGIEGLPDADEGGDDASASLPDVRGDASGNPDGNDGGGVKAVDAGTLQALSGMAPELFGAAVALSPDGHWLAVGAPGYGEDSYPGSPYKVGAVFLYERNAAGAYEQSTGSDKLLGPADFDATQVGGGFGRALAFSLDGTLLAVGVPHSARFLVPDVGSVFVYSLSAGRGFTPYTFMVSDFPANTGFGTAVAFGGPIATAKYNAQLYVGAPGAVSNGPPASVYSYALANGDAGGGSYWGAIDSPAAAGDLFGFRLAATSGSLVFVGAPGSVTASGSGAAYLLDLSATTAPEPDSGAHPTVPPVDPRSLDFPHDDEHELGAALAVSGDGGRVAIGATGVATNGVAPPLGAVFQLTSNGDPDAAGYAVSNMLSGGTTSSYGATLAITAGSLAVGDPVATVDGLTGAGLVYRYDGQPDAQAAVTLQPPSVLASGAFGTSLAFTPDGATLVIGAPGTASVAGNVYIYSY